MLENIEAQADPEKIRMLMKHWEFVEVDETELEQRINDLPDNANANR